ncbi:MAG: hypothetical protein QOE05_3792 [Actinomycetota bacterium]|jgi:hypothetical protein|nr:hypothetical protein [Actinomycetota bacterium]
MPDLRRKKAVAWALVGAVVIMLAYWLTWYFGDRSLLASSTRPAYIEFENAFPLADAWLSGCALLAAEALWRGRRTALLWLLTGGGAGIYLAAMDVLYDLEHDIWTSGGGGAIELAINVITVVASVATLRWGWRRRTLLA